MARAYPEHPLPSCHALVRRGNDILLVRRARPPLQGYWSVPGGGIELGETAAEAVVREVREETGLTVEVSRFLGYADAIERDESLRVRYHYVILYFEARPIDGNLLSGDDAAEVRWMSRTEAEAERLTDSVQRCLAWADRAP